jgi:OmpA-OmpF porin, OOP family
MQKLILLIVTLSVQFGFSQKVSTPKFDVSTLPISNAELGVFPYFKTIPNFKHYNSDSVTVEHNMVFFYDGEKYIGIEGKVSSQKLNRIDDSKGKPSEFQLIQEFDKIINTLGGKKIYTGELPTKLLKPIAGTDDIVSLYFTNQIVSSAHYGVVEYVVKTKNKEVWIQLQPFSLESNFYTLLVVEKDTKLISLNTNKANAILKDLDEKAKAVVQLEFEPDSIDDFLSQSADEILNIVNVYQERPAIKLKIEVHNAPIGKPEYILELSKKRAETIKNKLLGLGVKAAQLEVVGMGDTKAIVPNENEKSRITNTRVEIIKLK